MRRHLVFRLLTLIFLTCTASWAQVDDKEPLDREELEAVEVAKGWPEIYSRPFLAALSLGVEKAPQEVLKTLGPVLNRSDVPPLLLALQARALEASGEPEKSIDIYEQAIERAGNRIGDLPWNLHLKLGGLLLAEGQIAKARPQLELAWQVDDYQKKDRAKSYGLLALAYEAEGRTEEARQAIEAAIGCDPMEEVFWEIRADLPLHGEEPRSDHPTPPWVPAPADAGLRKILWYGYPFSWDPIVRWDGIDTYLEYARALEGVGRVNEALHYRSATMLKALGPTYALCRTGDPTSCLNSLATLSLDPEYQKRAPLFIRGYVLGVEFRKHAQLENYLHAVAALEELVDLRGAEYLDEAFLRKLVLSLQFQVFGWVSFDAKTGVPRTSDPDDFIELFSEAEMEELMVTLGEEAQGLRHYGMVSPSEDDANVSARAVPSNGEPERIKVLQDLIEARIRERNLELPVKFLLNDQGYKFLELPLQAPGDTLRKRLDAAMADAGGEIQEQTLIGYTVGCRLIALLKRLPGG